MNAPTDPGAGPFPLGYGDPRNALLTAGGNTADCGPHCTAGTSSNPDGTHCSCTSCHGKQDYPGAR